MDHALRFNLQFTFNTKVYSSNSGVWPGSRQPKGLVILAMLSAAVCEFTRPTNSSMSLGGWPAAAITVGAPMNRAMMQSVKVSYEQSFYAGRVVNSIL